MQDLQLSQHALALARHLNCERAADMLEISRPALSRRRVVTLPFRQPWLHTNYGFAYLKDRVLSPAAQAFMAEVKAVEAERIGRA